jgi:hypothetical protein
MYCTSRPLDAQPFHDVLGNSPRAVGSSVVEKKSKLARFRQHGAVEKINPLSDALRNGEIRSCF